MSFSLRCFASLLSVAISCCMYLLDAHFLQREVDVPFAHSHPVRRVAVTYEDLRSLVLSGVGNGVGMREADVDFALEKMRIKQTQHEIATESSDAKQRRLNDIVNRGLERQQNIITLESTIESGLWCLAPLATVATCLVVALFSW